MSGIFGEEALEALSYERSKTWSNVIKYYEEKDEGNEMDVRKFDDIFKDQDESSIVALEEAKDEETQDVLYKTTQCMTKSELMQMLCSGDNKEILDQTLPIVEEHVRKWKEFGLDRILDTFDAQKIEEHVGDWLRRNNSAYSNESLLQLSPHKSCSKRYSTDDQVYSTSSSNDSETESMHSVDTARYVRASRKRFPLSAVSKCSSPMTTIKMYRTLSRKRAELRAKYGCDELNEEQEHRHHMQALHHRRKQNLGCEQGGDLIFHTNPRHYSCIINGQQRRKQLRKRRSTSPIICSSSSSEDDREHFRCDCLRNTAYSRYANRSYHSRNINSSDYSCKRLKLGSRIVQCPNNDRLGSSVVHIANRSTQSWLIENRSCSSRSKKCRMALTYRCKARKQSMLYRIVRGNVEDVDLKLSTRFTTTEETKGNEDQSYSSASSVESVSTEKSTCSNYRVTCNTATCNRSSQACSSTNHSNNQDSCTRVSSTAVASQQSPFSITTNGILLYEPPQSTASADEARDISTWNNCNTNFELTEHILSPIIGHRRARKFLKYYMGSCSFNSRYHVYYRPSTKLMVKLSGTAKTVDSTPSSCSESDDEIFEMLGRYGAIHTVLKNNTGST